MVDYVSRLRSIPMRELPYNELSGTVDLGLDGSNYHGIPSYSRLTLIGQLQPWLPRRVDMQGWRRGQMRSSENSSSDVFRYTGVFKGVRIGSCEIEKSVCTLVLLPPYSESVDALSCEPSFSDPFPLTHLFPQNFLSDVTFDLSCSCYFLPSASGVDLF